ncbi:S-layer homology domain-containing protein [Paenibacillus sp. TRM 82003]|nr:S-layer homology domain-containing protein [Paenibacillus sp. TRM 82003]
MTIAAAGVLFSPGDNGFGKQVFSDVHKDSYYYDAVLELSAAGVLNGFSDGTFRPNQPITRAEAASLLTNSLGLANGSVDAVQAHFSDIAEQDWYLSAVLAMEERGIVQGYPDGTFRPADSITRAEMAKMIAKGHHFLEDDTIAVRAFQDVGASDWFAEDVTSLSRHQIIQGRTDVTFEPYQPVTRGEAAVLVSRARQAHQLIGPVSIEGIEEDRILAAGRSYPLDDAYASIFGQGNADILRQAEIVFESKGGALSSIERLALHASGEPSDAAEEFRNNLVLDGKGATVGELAVNGNFVTVKHLLIAGDLILSEAIENDFYSENVTVRGVTSVRGGDSNTIVFDKSNLGEMKIEKTGVHVALTGDTSVGDIVISTNAALSSDSDTFVLPSILIATGAKAVELTGNVLQVEVERNHSVTLGGITNVFELVVRPHAKVDLGIGGSLNKLSAHEHSLVTVTGALRIDDILLPEGTKVEDIVSNYREAKHKFTKINSQAIVSPSGSADVPAPAMTLPTLTPVQLAATKTSVIAATEQVASIDATTTAGMNQVLDIIWNQFDALETMVGSPIDSSNALSLLNQFQQNGDPALVDSVNTMVSTAVRLLEQQENTVKAVNAALRDGDAAALDQQLRSFLDYSHSVSAKMMAEGIQSFSAYYEIQQYIYNVRTVDKVLQSITSIGGLTGANAIDREQLRLALEYGKRNNALRNVNTETYLDKYEGVALTVITQEELNTVGKIQERMIDAAN